MPGLYYPEHMAIGCRMDHYRRFIEETFDRKAFSTPLFYQYPGGLRFELSEPGAPIERFLTAITKASDVFKGVFQPSEQVLVCLRNYCWGARPFAHRKALAELRRAGVRIPRLRSIWMEQVCDDYWFEPDTPVFWVNVAFQVEPALLRSLLWCAFAADLGVIRPRSKCAIYLFNMDARIMVWPYDDRGMDVVGPNHERLEYLFHEYHRYLFEYDLEAMMETFAPRE